uniref:Rhodopsin domain-containing protein n=1 Tax=Talaromyces marneffei PM1 TaxID=1077442 RepID=A0A093UM92_TALMA
MAQDRGPTILIAMWTTTSIATLFVAARLFTRIRILRNIGLDDYLIASSMVIGLLFVSLATAAVTAGDGEHVSALSPYSFERAAMLSTAAYAPGIVSFVLPKLGVVALLCRIFNPTRRWRIFLWAFVGGSGAAIVAVVKCTHIPGLADESDPTYSTSELVIWTK